MSEGTTELASEDLLKEVEARLFVGGEWTDAVSGRTEPTLDPATGRTLATVADAGEEDVARAVAAAREGFVSPAWQGARPMDRERWLHALGDLLAAERQQFALLETLDNGMPIKLAERLVDRAVENLHYYAGWPSKLEGQTLTPASAPAGRFFAYTLREPRGVVAAIIPWNASITSATAKLGPAIACGNAVILKPSEKTPLTVLRLAELARRCGLPPGILNVLTGGPQAGKSLVAHPDVDLIAFTGSTATGQQVVHASAAGLKRVLVELGGKSPNVIFADADLERAIPGAARAIFGNSGQVCTAGSRIFVERSVADRVTAGVAEFAERLRVGPGVERGTQLGPLVSADQLDRVLSYVQSGVEEGARLIAGGRRLEDGDLSDGYFVAATVFGDVEPDMRIIREEIFGPVVAVTPFDEISEVIEAANATPYGLSAGVWTRDFSKAHAISTGVRAGTVWVNCYQLNDPAVPFGGYKLSGYGREYGSASIEEYTDLKSVWQAVEPQLSGGDG